VRARIGRYSAGGSSCDGEDFPAFGYAFEIVIAPIRELNVRSCDEILDGARHEQFAWISFGGDSVGDDDGESGDVVAA